MENARKYWIEVLERSEKKSQSTGTKSSICQINDTKTEYVKIPEMHTDEKNNRFLGFRKQCKDGTVLAHSPIKTEINGERVTSDAYKVIRELYEKNGELDEEELRYITFED